MILMRCLLLHLIAKLAIAMGHKFFPVGECFKLVEAFFCDVVHNSFFLLFQKPEDIEDSSLALTVPYHEANRGVIGHGAIFRGVKIESLVGRS